MIQHSLTMGNLSCVDDPIARGLLRPEWRLQAQRHHRFGHPTRSSAIDFSPVALEAERVVPIRTDFTAIRESGFPLLTRGAEDSEALRPTWSSVLDICSLQSGSVGTLRSIGREYQRRLTGPVIRPMFARVEAYTLAA
jgi:hypothetical protein